MAQPRQRPPHVPSYNANMSIDQQGIVHMPRLTFRPAQITSRRVSVYMDDVDEDDINEVAGMPRGLACAIDGFQADSNMTNDRFWTESPVIWPFSTVAKAKRFKECVEYYFDDAILEALKVKRRVITR